MTVRSLVCLQMFVVCAISQSFSDSFTGSLDPGWIVKPGIGTYSLTDNPNWLRTSFAGSTHPNGDAPSLWIHRSFNGTHWTLDFLVDYELPFGNGRQFFVKVILGDLSQMGLNEVWWWRSEDVGGGTPHVNFNEAGVHTSTPVPRNGPDRYYVRMTRAGQTFTVQRSDDGITYITVDSQTWVAPVGTAQTLLLSSANFAGTGYADYDYFHLEDIGDLTPPMISPNITGTLGNAGWYRSSVSVSWNVTDPESGIESSSGCGTSALTADTAGTVLTCSATNGAGLSASTSVTIKIDMTAPVMSATRTPAPNAAGWSNTNVTVNFACMDSGSGAGDPSPLMAVLMAEGVNQAIASSCTDNAGNTAATEVSSINIDKQAPAVSGATVSPTPQQAGSPSTLTANLTDSGPSGLASWQYTVDGGTPVVGSVSGTSATVTASVTFPVAGVYELCTTTADLAGNISPAICAFAVIYDPSAGFVTGGGWFDSPAGAYVADPALAGRATIGFVSKYHNGASVPTGSTQFQFHAGNLSFKSTSYEWLVVSGARAQYKGVGKVNGVDGYSFMLTAIDGERPGGGGIDRVRIKIWGSAGLVYDNLMGGSDNADPSTAVGGGNIVIHQ